MHACMGLTGVNDSRWIAMYIVLVFYYGCYRDLLERLVYVVYVQADLS